MTSKSLRRFNERTLERFVIANNHRVRRHDPVKANPRDIENELWHQVLVDAHPEMAAEWAAFREQGLRLPQMDELISPDRCALGAPGPYWQVGGLIAIGRPVRPTADWFPHTVAALGQVPGLQSAVISVMGPGKDLGSHEGPNAGALRLLFGIDCGDRAALQIGDQLVPYQDGRGIMFDDTQTHSAWNDGNSERVVLMCDVLRPLPLRADLPNRVVQYLHHMTIREFRSAPLRVAEWHAALNPSMPAPRR